MSNYYEILGLTPDAGSYEIKSAFRQLAKLYHPDKNPEGVEYFTRILKAYETLSDPALRSSYDYKLSARGSSVSEQPSKKANTKTWRFDERELKRRQYYNEHIKKYAKTAPAGFTDAEKKKTYNEFKYILFATPLAVALFLLIMNLATDNKQSPAEAELNAMTRTSKNDVKNVSSLKMGDAPYSGLFGYSVYDTIDDRKIRIKNITGAEIIVCLFTKNNFIRSFYVQNGYAAEVSQLPDDSIYIRYASGNEYDSQAVLKKARVYGAFTRNPYFFKSTRPASLATINELSLMPGLNEGFTEIDEKEFFKTPAE